MSEIPLHGSILRDRFAAPQDEGEGTLGAAQPSILAISASDTSKFAETV